MGYCCAVGTFYSFINEELLKYRLGSTTNTFLKTLFHYLAHQKWIYGFLRRSHPWTLNINKIVAWVWKQHRVLHDKIYTFLLWAGCYGLKIISWHLEILLDIKYTLSCQKHFINAKILWCIWPNTSIPILWQNCRNDQWYFPKGWSHWDSW